MLEKPRPANAPYRLAIFDFDGTLADSFPWFLSVMNDVADRFGFRRVAPAEIEALRGAGSREIVGHFGVPFWKLPQIATYMRALKAQSADRIALFPGTGAMLRDLKASGLTLAIVSSDSVVNVRTTLQPDVAALVDHYACGASLFGKAAKFKQVLRRSGIAPSACIAIGDEMRDADAARKAGIAFGAVSWGYALPDALATTRPAVVFSDVGDIVATLARAAAPTKL